MRTYGAIAAILAVALAACDDRDVSPTVPLPVPTPIDPAVPEPSSTTAGILLPSLTTCAREFRLPSAAALTVRVPGPFVIELSEGTCRAFGPVVAASEDGIVAREVGPGNYVVMITNKTDALVEWILVLEYTRPASGSAP